MKSDQKEDDAQQNQNKPTISDDRYENRYGRSLTLGFMDFLQTDRHTD
jgi:hypothetical protein